MAQQADYYAKNAERRRENARKWREANPERAREQITRWHRENPEHRSALRQATRARKASAPGAGIGVRALRAVLTSTAGLCMYCAFPGKLSLDHIDPLARGGAHDPDNAAPACRKCNASKNDTPLLVWLARKAA